MSKSQTPVARELTPHEAHAWMKADPALQIVDVRTSEEHKQARIAKSQLISLQTLDVRLQDIDKKKPVLLYCASGGRSGRALQYLESQGYQAKHVVGGIMGWAEAGLPYEI